MANNENRQNQGSDNERNLKGTWLEGVSSFVLAVMVALCIRWALVEAYTIPSGSMIPSLLIHDHIFVNKLVYGLRIPFSKEWILKFGQPQRGEVIVFRYPEDESQFFIKRVVGTPGDKVVYENDQLYINGEAIERTEASEDPYYATIKDRVKIEHPEKNFRRSDFTHFVERLGDQSHSLILAKEKYFPGGVSPLEVPPGRLFVMGDNRDNSNDSRGWGFVPVDNVIGRAMFIWLSCEETLENIPFLCNPLTIRWGRFFHSIHD